MIEILIYILIGISLSIDAFVAALSYGTILSRTNEKILLVSTIGLLHFIMPLIGSYIAYLIKDISLIKTKYIVIIIFILLIIGMIKEDNHNSINITNILNIILLGLAVSIDSLSIGIALSLSDSKIILAALIFSIISATTTLIGIKIGNFITQKYNNKAKIVGIILMIIVIIKYLIID